MRDAYQVAAVRTAERALMEIVPDGTLMGRAAAGLASVCAALLRREPGYVYGARVVVLAGSGDNGGDALYAGALLARRGAAVTAIAAGSRVHPGGTRRAARGGRPGDRRHGGRGRPDLMTRADLIIDGLLGIGGRGGLREPFAGLAARAGHARQAGATVVAVDLPSGIDADTGAVDGPAVRADVTVTFGAIKPGLLIDPGAGHAGAVELVDIGLGPYLKDGPQRRGAAAGRHPRAAAPPGRRIGQVPPGRARPAGRQRPLHRRGAARHRRGGARRGGHGPGGHRGRRRRAGPAGVAGDRGHRAPRRGRLGPARFGRPGPGVGGRPGHGHRPGRRGAADGDAAAPTCPSWWTRTG